ncbi:MAG: sensor histidine kinase [Opitutaceae bacterium]
MNLDPKQYRSHYVEGLVSIIVVFAIIIGVVSVLMRRDMRQEILHRDAEILAAVTDMLAEDIIQEQLRYFEEVYPAEIATEVGLLASGVRGVVAISIHDTSGSYLEGFPDDLLPIPLTADLLSQAETGMPTRFHDSIPLTDIFNSNDELAPQPMLEVVLPLSVDSEDFQLHFWLDGKSMEAALAALDARIFTQALGSWLAGSLLFIVIADYFRRRLRQRQCELESRTKELWEANLDRDLQAKSTALGAIATSLVHDLRSPLAALQFAISEDEVDTQVALQLIRRIQETTAEVVAIIRDQQHVSALPYKWEELSDNLKRHFMDERLQVLGAMEKELSAQHGGLALLCLKQLVGNALRASSEGSPVTVSCDGDDDGQLSFSVVDRAGGLPDTIRESLFRPGDELVINGSGIGLALARQIAVSIGGSLRLHRSDQTGSHFILSLSVEQQA